MNEKSEHTFHIPVMGLAFTVDSPIKVARFGISSVISIMEDKLIEMMRKHYYPLANKEYVAISEKEEDYRAKRITDYLNLVNEIVEQQIEKLRTESFETDSEIVKYFELLPKESKLKKLYAEMQLCEVLAEKKIKQDYLRTQIIAGSIDVNIMTKVDKETLDSEKNIIANGSDAVTALRGYAQSRLTNSSIIFSAGMNPRLYNYLESLIEFNPNDNFLFNKHVVVKVSDYRSALIQGKFLAKKGIWVSEFRIESGLNCGGHAFATDGILLGPILEDFKTNRVELTNSIFEIYKIAIENKSGLKFTSHPEINISVQGGIGTYEEDKFLHNYYNVSSTGWGTPFLLVPEATTVDEHTMSILCNATEKDIKLSHNSPLGVRFNYLLGTTADAEKQKRILAGKPGSPCVEKHLMTNTEFTKEPICTASAKYQSLKLKHLSTLNLTDNELTNQRDKVLSKECLCVGLSNSAALLYNRPFIKNMKAVNICPGPNIVNFSKIVSIKTMIDHIYGRENIVTNKQRPHMFIAELNIYFNYIKEQLVEAQNTLATDIKKKTFYKTFVANMSNAINYYQDIKEQMNVSINDFSMALKRAEEQLIALKLEYGLN